MTYKSLTNPAAEGGTVTTSGVYRIHTFTSSGIFTTNKSMNVEVLVVAGGGSGGKSYRFDYAGGGGGGAGGLVYNSAFAVTPQVYAVTVGAGGATQTTADSRGFNGSNSSFSTITAIGGGGGGEAPTNQIGGNGGSGGGSAFNTSTPGLGTSGQGNNGGIVTGGINDGGAEGGGAGAVGGDVTDSLYGGNGGAGLSFNISGSISWYAGGGGGGNYYTGSGGTGGIGGGGAGGTSGSSGIAGTANTGGGGGGCGTFGTLGNGGAGGSGTVITRYLLSEDLAPANITAIGMTVTPSETPCRVGICTVNVSVTWKNNGGSTGSFVPSITVDSGTVTPVYSSELLEANIEVTHTFTVSDMTTGTRSICPNPN